MTNLARYTVAQRFNRAAARYDKAASLQEQIATSLVQKAIATIRTPPSSILDIGCGTGFVSAAAAHHWPQAHLTAIDVAPAMLKEARRKIPHLQVIEGDAANQKFGQQFDLILSSMVLQWLPDPQAALGKWRRWLTPNGRMLIATLTSDSFQEWHDLCAKEGLTDGLQNLPDSLMPQWIIGRQKISVEYASAKDFIHRMKVIGASTPRPGHKPFSVPSMRRLLAHAPRPFTVTYGMIYINAPSPDSI